MATEVKEAKGLKTGEAFNLPAIQADPAIGSAVDTFGQYDKTLASSKTVFDQLTAWNSENPLKAGIAHILGWGKTDRSRTSSTDSMSSAATGSSTGSTDRSRTSSTESIPRAGTDSSAGSAGGDFHMVEAADYDETLSVTEEQVSEEEDEEEPGLTHPDSLSMSTDAPIPVDYSNYPFETINVQNTNPEPIPGYTASSLEIGPSDIDSSDAAPETGSETATKSREAKRREKKYLKKRIKERNQKSIIKVLQFQLVGLTQETGKDQK